MTNENAQQKYLEFQLLSRQSNIMNQQVQLISNKIAELKLLIESMDELSNLKTGHEILVPIGPGILINTSVKNNNQVLMNIGANIVVNKSVEDSKKIIESQINDLENAFQQSEKDLIALNSELDSLRKEIQYSDE
ncbi:MAG: prefoldin subunit alpha [Nanoarchaeota archaeon]